MFAMSRRKKKKNAFSSHRNFTDLMVPHNLRINKTLCHYEHRFLPINTVINQPCRATAATAEAKEEKKNRRIYSFSLYFSPRLLSERRRFSFPSRTPRRLVPVSPNDERTGEQSDGATDYIRPNGFTLPQRIIKK